MYGKTTNTIKEEREKRKEMLKEKKTPTKKKKITEKSVIVWTKRRRTKYDEYLGSIACYVSKKRESCPSNIYI